jgi:Immunity protein 74
MFSVPKANFIESDSGYSVEVLGRTGIKYREHGKSMFIDSEVLSQGYGIQIFVGSIAKWDPPHDKEVVSHREVQEIVQNIRLAFEFYGQPVVFD